MRIFRSVAIALTVLFSVASAEASPITGAFSIVGNFKPVNGVTGAVSSLGAATGLDFLALFGTTSTPGPPGGMLVTQATGSLAGLTGSMGTIRDFSFAGAGSTNFPNLSVPLVNVSEPRWPDVYADVGGRPAWPEQLDAVAPRSGHSLMAGYTNTAGTFVFTGNGEGGTFSFSSSQAGARFRSRRRWPCSVADFWSAPPSSAVVVAPARPDKHRDHTRIRRDERPAGLVSPVSNPSHNSALFSTAPLVSVHHACVQTDAR